MAGTVQKKRLELFVRSWVNPNTRMPFRLAAADRRDATSAVADRVAFKLDRMAPAIADLITLLLLEGVVAFRRK